MSLITSILRQHFLPAAHNLSYNLQFKFCNFSFFVFCIINCSFFFLFHLGIRMQCKCQPNVCAARLKHTRIRRGSMSITAQTHNTQTTNGKRKTQTQTPSQTQTDEMPVQVNYLPYIASTCPLAVAFNACCNCNTAADPKATNNHTDRSTRRPQPNEQKIC